MKYPFKISTVVFCLLCLSPIYGEDFSVKFSEPTNPLSFDKEKSYIAIIHTSKGKIECHLNQEEAPLSVTNFIQLVEGQFYDGLLFHKVVPGFVVLAGDPEGTGSGGVGYTLPSEIGLKHEAGVLAWARLPDQLNPSRRSSGSQFYITLDKVSFLDGEYSVFGQVIEGFDVISKICQGDKIESVEIVVK